VGRPRLEDGLVNDDARPARRFVAPVDRLACSSLAPLAAIRLPVPLFIKRPAKSVSDS